ncbi:hypothetical protein Tco_0740383, partial [Tanacetum coccineum]
MLGVEEESMLVYDTDIEDVIEEEEGFVGKRGFGGEEDNIEDVVVVANDLCSSMIQTTLSADFKEDINTKSHELRSINNQFQVWIIARTICLSLHQCCRIPTAIMQHHRYAAIMLSESRIKVAALSRSKSSGNSGNAPALISLVEEKVGILEEKGEEQGFDSKEDEVVPKVEDVSLVDGALGGDGDEDFEIREWEEAWVKAMEKEGIEEEENEDDEENEGDDYLIKMRWINV